MSLFLKIHLLPAYYNIEYDNHQIDTNTRTKKIYFRNRYNGQYIENSFFKKSVIIWNKLTDDKVIFKEIVTYSKSKDKIQELLFIII